ncbi:MAG: hypothetical protein M3Q31_09975 [Actinomycetota bacterium]|nr:hypothetical protein [Actinomycetota bacterium]
MTDEERFDDYCTFVSGGCVDSDPDYHFGRAIDELASGDPECYEHEQAREQVWEAFGERYPDDLGDEVAEEMVPSAEYNVSYDHEGNVDNAYLTFPLSPEEALQRVLTSRRREILARTRKPSIRIVPPLRRLASLGRQPRPRRTRRAGSRARSPGRLSGDDDPSPPSDLARRAAA